MSDSLDGEGENGSLSLIDVVRVDDNMLEELDLRDACAKVRRCVNACLSGREAHIIRLRYGLDDQAPLTQREIASLCGISRSYVSRRAYCKRCPESLAVQELVRALDVFGSAVVIVSGGEISIGISGHSMRYYNFTLQV